jgi:hypothetical protein
LSTIPHRRIVHQRCNRMREGQSSGFDLATSLRRRHVLANLLCRKWCHFLPDRFYNQQSPMGLVCRKARLDEPQASTRSLSSWLGSLGCDLLLLTAMAHDNSWGLLQSRTRTLLGSKSRPWIVTDKSFRASGAYGTGSNSDRYVSLVACQNAANFEV